MRNEANIKRGRRRFLSGATGVAAAALLVGVAGTGTAGSAPVARGEMTFLATHPWAASQPTSTGRQIVELEASNGRVWAGYGDYGANTGPITLAAHDGTANGTFEPAHVSDTEAIYNIRSLGTELLAPATDPRNGADFASGTPWIDSRPLGATHVYDTATLDGTDRWMVGSQGNDAVAWRSLDGGASWEEALRIPPTSTLAKSFARFYFAAAFDGSLYLQPVDYYDGPTGTSVRFDGEVWSEAPSLLPEGGGGWRPQAYRAGVIYHHSGHGKAGNVYYFDGTEARVVAHGYDFEVDGDSVLVLQESGAIASSGDLNKWSVVAQAPATARSLALDSESIYVGTTSSELWSMTRYDRATSPSKESTPSNGRGEHPQNNDASDRDARVKRQPGKSDRSAGNVETQTSDS